MAQKLKNPQSLSIILGGGMVAIMLAGLLTAATGFGFPLIAEGVVGVIGMAAGARVA